MKLLLDQGLPRSAAALLCEADIDTLHVAQIALSAAEDREILIFAQDDKRVVVTLDSDFHALLALTEATSPSVIRIRIQSLRAPALTELLFKVINKCEADLQQGAVVTVEPSRIRVRHLPLLK
ncbi:DUF5615 family PIN-like protein [Mastigocoleus sp. MO_188.B34]|uniref:DUF5615 family PIN-like protein n=1 Tax=Mastigocoleus sp. MO_188.B34 TaxID=3036635 RepID=UPI0026072229|nr:DUF5615 family PIN-like protein [Mastigocoleus sp. MO_188.B34]MDJ0694862.1 DUF5615 family PIN-like protein [Mastigocoleus sp. MO_188.B34]